MKWTKLGKIFDPRDYALPSGCTLFAQSPQALVSDTHIRIYFSTRTQDSTGKYLSHIAYADFSHDLKTVLRIAEEPVIGLGGLGCFDEHGIFPINPLRVKDKIYAYTCGWNRRVSVSVDTAIGLAISTDDGATFQRIGHGPILAATVREPFLVGDPFVQIIDGTFHMWYIFGTEWVQFASNTPPDRIYKIGHATSENGIDWRKEDGKHIITDVIGAGECQALPTVIKVDNQYMMCFCFRYPSDFRTNRLRSYRLGFAYSTDLANWVRDDKRHEIGLEGDGWDHDMMCYPHLFSSQNRIHLLYNGNEFGKYGFGAAVLE